MSEKEFKVYRIGSRLPKYGPPKGINYERFEIAKEAAETFASHEGVPYYIFEIMEVVNEIGVVGGEQDE